MEKHKYTQEEVDAWRKEHFGMFYFNRDDLNLFVPRRLWRRFLTKLCAPDGLGRRRGVAAVLALIVFRQNIFG